VTWRNPKAVVDLISPIYAKAGRAVRQGNDRIGGCKVVYIPGPGSVPSGHDMYLTFRQDEKLTMSMHHRLLSSNTIHERQGDKAKSVALVRLKTNNLAIFDSEPHLIVALTRTEEFFTYYTSNPYDRLSDILKRGALQDFSPPVRAVFS
jgi:hypothetical protein